MQDWLLRQSKSGIYVKNKTEDREDNIDIYGEIGNSDSKKVHPELLKKGNSIYPEAGGAFMKAKISPEEKHHFYISEAELHMHQPWTLLWAKHEMYFQTMMVEGSKMNEENSSC
nr:hypothetical protein CFP56_51591 [Quercus suber]